MFLKPHLELVWKVIQKIGEQYFESGWIVVRDRTGKEGIGSSAKFELSMKIMNPILHQNKELADVMDELSGLKNVRENQGAMGILTNSILPRDICYAHGIIFAFAPWLSDAKYWQ